MMYSRYTTLTFIAKRGMNSIGSSVSTPYQSGILQQLTWDGIVVTLLHRNHKAMNEAKKRQTKCTKKCVTKHNGSITTSNYQYGLLFTFDDVFLIRRVKLKMIKVICNGSFQLELFRMAI